MQVNQYFDLHLLKHTQNCCVRQHVFDIYPYREENKSSLPIASIKSHNRIIMALASIQWTRKNTIFRPRIVKK